MVYEFFVVAMILTLCGALLLGFPVAFTLSGVALIFAYVGFGLDLFELAFVQALPNRIYGIMTNDLLIAVPLFVFMGVMLERSKLAEALLDTMALLMSGVRGGLGIAVCIVGALLALAPDHPGGYLAHVARMEHLDPQVGRAAVAALLRIAEPGDVRLAPYLVRAIRAGDPAVAGEAATALGILELGTPNALRELRRAAAGDDQLAVRAKAALKQLDKR